MSGKRSYRLRWLISLITGLSLFAALLGPVQAIGPAMPASPQNGTVTIPPGNPIEIATIFWTDWEWTPDHLDAVQMALNDYGSIKGFALQRNDYNGGCGPVDGENVANQVVANAQNVGAIGPTCSSSTRGAAPILETAGVVMISHSNTAVDLPPYGPTTFNRVAVEDPVFEGWDILVSELPSAGTWEAQFDATYGHPPNTLAKYAYDATILLLTHIEGVSTVDGSSNLVIDRAALAAAVRGTTGFSGVTGDVSLDGATGNRLNALTGSGTRYVDTAGTTDGNNCTNPAVPCPGVQRAIFMANPGEIVVVTGGTYVENLTINKDLELYGGYEAGTWNRDLAQYETILDGSGSGIVPGDWDQRVRYPMVLKDGTMYKMWYTGYDLLGTNRIGYATSLDGLNWARGAADPVLGTGAAGEWDSNGVEAAFVIQESPISYKMWYSGFGPGGCGIGYATSNDGVVWARHPGNPVLTPGAAVWNNVCVLHPSLLYEGGVYKMWLMTIGDDGGGQAPYIAYATSFNGLSWTWEAGNPLFGRDWEDWLWRPDVLHVGGTYQMWHSVSSGNETQTTYASSLNETAWTKQGSAVLSGTPGEWDEGSAIDPSVLHVAGTYTMYYDNHMSIGVATSTNGIDWTKPMTQPVLMPGAPGHWGQPVVTVHDGAVLLDGLTLTGGSGEDGGGVSSWGNTTIRYCTIRDNQSANAGGVMAHEDSLTITHSYIVGNEILSEAEPGSTGGAGGVRATTASVVMTNAVVAGNRGDAGIHANGDLTLVNVTVADNDGDVIFNPTSPSTLAILNSIVYLNNPQHLGGCPEGSICNVNYSDIEGGWPGGTGNLDEDPLFIGGGNYRLWLKSPCVDWGTSASAPADDIEGRPRDARPDMGAYEAVAHRVYLPIVLRGWTPAGAE